MMECYWVLFIVLTFSFTFSFSIRNNIGFEIMNTHPLCNTTVQSRYLLSDHNGYVCNTLSVNSHSRCCPQTSARFSCHGCNVLSRCCNSYEYCVSCCLNPAHTCKEQVLKLKIAKPSTARTYASVFEYCAGRCRHSSESVVHENAYLSDFHHCFSLPSNSSGTDTNLPEARLNGINVVVGRQGEACDSACKLRGQSCVPNKLSVLNNCDIIQKYMSCKGACLASVGPDKPAEVVHNAPNHMNPGSCLYTQTQSILSCGGSHQHTRRLCPCA
ncbi:hypothetical protein Lal_00034963 [Lupinus albus]|uniref:SREBP regulating gene protein n=1 Tax=Lupinus albus TaxID=3870 RepID=A0A6A4QRP5_LUPAL|nr:hypothetical protein Lalb_Chr03g0026141 [Lupinus albus]KAF1897260.1 hypothetical protein Lal_00034963 [Lupinus albus]